MRRIFRTHDVQPDAERDVDEELRSQLELVVEDLMAQGMGEEEARAEARRRVVGHATAAARAAAPTRTHFRRRTVLDRFDTLARDARHALRRMARSPGFAAIAVLSLAIGIGANTAVFSVVNGLFLRPPPYRAPREIVHVWTGMPDRPPSGDITWTEYQGVREVEGVFSGVGAFDTRLVRLRDGEGTRSAYVEAVTPNLFPMLGIEPALGRFFLPNEGSHPGGDPLAILGHGYWIRAFDGDPGVLGGTVHIAGVTFTIVGVAPPELSALQSETLTAELFVPLSMAGLISGRTDAQGDPLQWPRSVNVMARLAPGITPEVAQGRVGGLAREIREARGSEAPDGWGFRLWSAEHLAVSPPVDASLVRIGVFLMVVAALVLLLACTNLANLVLARGVDRRREMAVRVAMGARRARLVKQLLTEAGFLAVLGGVVGLLLAHWTLGLLLRLQPNAGVTLTLDTSPDVRVLLFSLGTVALAGLLFGLAPALASTRSGISPALAGGPVARPGRSLGLERSLVALQMAVSVLLLTGAGLFVHSLLEARTTDPGFRAGDGVAVWVDLQRSGVPRGEWPQMMEALRERASTSPGVERLAVTDALPLGSNDAGSFRIPGVAATEGREAYQIPTYRVDEDYLDLMGIPLLSGRGIQAADREDTPGVVVVSQAAARRYWPGEIALGKEIIETSSGRRVQVVGVVGDVKVERLGEPPRPTLYFPWAQAPSNDVYLVALGGGGPGALVASLRRAVTGVDPDLLVMTAQSLRERVGVTLYPARMAAGFLTTCGALALFLAAIGLYGVVSLSVSRRIREMGIRMAVGADAGSVVSLVLRGSLISVTVGSAAGLGLAFAGARLVRSFLFGVSPADPVTLVVVPLVLGAVALMAAFVPALRASKMDPVEALRTE